jgi:hypothetical protein
MKEIMDRNYFAIRNKLNSIEKERREALSSGDIKKYFSLSAKGGFDVENELIESYPVEYNEVFNSKNSVPKRGKSLEKVAFKNGGYLKPKEYKEIEEILSDNFLKTTYAASSLDYRDDLKSTLRKVEETGLVMLPDYENMGVRNLMVVYSEIKNWVKRFSD